MLIDKITERSMKVVDLIFFHSFEKIRPFKDFSANFSFFFKDFPPFLKFYDIFIILWQLGGMLFVEMVRKNLIVNGCCWLWVALLRFGSFWFIFESLRMLVQPKDFNVFHNYENPYNGAYSKETKQLYTMLI